MLVRDVLDIAGCRQGGSAGARRFFSQCTKAKLSAFFSCG